MNGQYKNSSESLNLGYFPGGGLNAAVAVRPWWVFRRRRSLFDERSSRGAVNKALLLGTGSCHRDGRRGTVHMSGFT